MITDGSGQQKCNDKVAMSTSDEHSLVGDLYAKEAHKEWSNLFHSEQGNWLPVLPNPSFGGLFAEGSDAKGGVPTERPRDPLSGPEDPPLVKEFHRREKEAFEPLEAEARQRIEQIVKNMPPDDRANYEKENEQYQKEMAQHFATGTLLSPEPEPGPTMTKYMTMVDQALKPIEMEKKLTEIKVRQSMPPEFEKQEEQLKRRRETWV